MNAPIPLWKPLDPGARKEPFAVLTYGNVAFEIPYTLMRLLSGWVAIGKSGAGDTVYFSGGKLQVALDYLSSAMAYDANPPTQEELFFYRNHCLPCERPSIPQSLYDASS